ncbi:hypothetical protein [Dialister invisus]
MRETLIVIRSEREGSATIARKTVKHHLNNRFFTPCHAAVSHLSHKAFLPPFRMTILGKHVTNNGERKAS